MNPKLIWRIISITVALSIIALIWAITISPIEFIRFKRDRQRASDIYKLVEILEKMERQSPQAFKGEPDLVYVSLPDNDPACSNWELPPLAEDFSYRCASFTNYRQINGAGWLPVDLSTDKESTLSSLPIDPYNGKKIKDLESGKKRLLFYQYVRGSFAVGTSYFESLLGQQQAVEVAYNDQHRRMEQVIEGEKPSTAAILFDGGLMAGTAVKEYVATFSEAKRQGFVDQAIKEQEFFIKQITEDESQQKLVFQHFSEQLFGLTAPLSKENLQEIDELIEDRPVPTKLARKPVKTVVEPMSSVPPAKPIEEVDPFDELGETIKEPEIVEIDTEIEDDHDIVYTTPTVPTIPTEPEPEIGTFEYYENKCLPEGGELEFVTETRVCCFK